ncbi:MAG: SusC/RagA family TonB-linked outer membrane protein, partial [Prevotellaceae bacterium]|nr:SusC/RagA family TonB-linked outer membrane protein [Prevotellaceae bacterium]
PIIGAVVRVGGADNVGTVTDTNGKFSLALPEGKNRVSISYVGMITREVVAKGKSMTISLESSDTDLSEVMVVAYGTAKKSSFTGSATQVNSEDIEKHIATSVTSALTGSVPGLQTLSTNGDPTDNDMSIRIRGIGSMNASNAPLYILDGVPYDGPLNAINPQDVETMTVLKDAAANAIYGARGANGVILITTKKGKSGDGEIKFDAKWGSNSRLIPQYDVIKDPGQYYETVYKMLYNSKYYNGSSVAESHAYAQKNLLDQNNGGLGYLVYTVPEGQNLIGTNFKLNPNATLGYSDGEYYYTPDNWYDETYHSSFRQEYNISANGSSERLNYYAGVGYLEDGGIVDNSKMKRYTGRLNADYRVKSWLSVTTNMNFAHTDSQVPAYDNTEYMSSGNLFYIVNNMGPIYPLYVRNADGTIMKDDAGNTVYDANQTNFTRPNTVGNAVRDNAYDRSKTYRDVMSGKWSVMLTPVEGLTLSATLGANIDNSRSNHLYSELGYYTASDGAAAVTHIRQSGINTQYLANYKTTIANDHHLELLAGYEQYQYKYQYFYGSNDHLYDPLIGELSNATGTSNKSLSSYTTNYMTEGFLSRVQYDYNEKYFVSASYRRDGSSRFAKGHRGGNFGSLGLAWMMTKEKFMKEAKWIDELKVKFSYGVQGNDNLFGSANQYPYADLYSASYNEETGEYSVSLVQKGNEDLTWETSHAYNMGIDFALFKHRLNGTIEYFARKTSDLLYNKPTPLSSGIPTGSYPTNIGNILNQGVEIDLEGVVLKKKNINMAINLNLTHYTNEIKKLDPSVAESGIKGSYYIYEEGGSLYEAYLYKYAGVNENGQALYYKEVTDDDGNTSIETTTTFADATQFDCGSTLPKLFGGLGLSLETHGFDLSFNCSFQLGGKIYDGQYQTLMWTYPSQSLGSAVHKDVLKAWSEDNTSSNIPRWDGDNSVGQSAVDRFLTSSNYLSLDNVTVGYTFPRSMLSKIHISSLRIYVAGENLAVATARKGLDPRFSLGIGSYVYGSGSAGNYYSAMRTITAGLTLTF